MKRVLMFLLLLAVGIGALWLVVAHDSSAGNNPPIEPRNEGTDRPRPPPGIPLPGRGGVSMSQTGPLTLPGLRAVPLGDGRERLEQVYEVHAARSEPVGEGLQRLDDVDVKLFDGGVHVATVTATQAFVTLMRDANGQVSLSEGKEVDLRTAVLTGVRGTKLGGLRLELGDAKIRIEDAEAVLTTARDQPVSLVLAGAATSTLHGRGAIARLPRKDGTLLRTEVEILQDPVLEVRDTTVRARGPLRYVEDMKSGLAQVTITNDVLLESKGNGLVLPGLTLPDEGKAVRSDAPTTVRGDEFVGWLQRERALVNGRERQQVLWRHLELTGAPATVDVQGGVLSTPRLTALPGLTGEPYLVTAHGASRVEQTEAPADPQRQVPASSRQQALANGTAARALHVVRMNEYVGSSYRAFGFPRWTLAPIDATQVVIGEGESHFTNDRRTVVASNGMRLWRRDGVRAGTVQGLGDVHVTQLAKGTHDQDIVATGDNGFVMHVAHAAQTLRLGPPVPRPGDDARNAFDVRHGDARLVGHGNCEVTRKGDDTHAHVMSPRADVVATMPAEGLELRHVHDLRTRLVGDEVAELEADGWPTELSLARARDEEKVVARAPRIVQIGPRSLRLLPVPAGAPAAAWPLGEADRMPSVRRTARRSAELALETVEVTGPEIDVHHAGGSYVLVEARARGGELAHVYGNVPQPDGAEATTIACDAERLRLLPFVLTPDVRDFHARTGGPFAMSLFRSFGRPWLIIDDVRDFQLDDARQGHVEGSGRRVLVSQGGRAALFIGDAATAAPAEVRRMRDGRAVTLHGARVRVFDTDDRRLDALDTFVDGGPALLPTMTLRDAGKKDLLSHVRATCRGNIEVRSEAIVFGGPVVATGLLDDGSEDPDGIHIDARELRMDRDTKAKDVATGETAGDIVRAVAKDVVADLPGLRAKGAEMELDVRGHRCIVSGPPDAVVDLHSGIRYVGPRLAVDYETLAVESELGRVTKRNVAMDGGR